MSISVARRVKGFTLIELLVVLFIISIVTATALLSIGHNQGKRLETFANDLAQLISLTQEQALLQPAVLGLLIKENSLQFMIYQPLPNQKTSTWQVFDDNVLKSRAIPNGISVRLQEKSSDESEDDNNQTPQIVFSTNGDVSPFILYISQSGSSPRYMIQGEANGNVITKTLR